MNNLSNFFKEEIDPRDNHRSRKHSEGDVDDPLSSFESHSSELAFQRYFDQDLAGFSEDRLDSVSETDLNYDILLQQASKRTKISPNSEISPPIFNHNYGSFSQLVPLNALPNAIHQRLTVRTHSKRDFATAIRLTEEHLEAMHNVELNIILLYNFSSNGQSAFLITSSLISLVGNILRTQGVKYFKNLNITTLEINTIRDQLLKISLKYYNQSVSLLKDVISSPYFEIPIAIIGSSILAKISMFWSEDLSLSKTFSFGMVSIFQDLYDKKEIGKLSNELAWTFNFLDFAAKSSNFPAYSPHYLKEYIRKCENLGVALRRYFEMFPDDPKKRILTYNFNNLINYVKMIDDLFKENLSGKIPTVPVAKLYEILRRWYIIIPPIAQILQCLKHPIEKLIGYYYKSFSRSLENLFPEVRSIFILSFSGGIPLFFEYISKHELKFDQSYTSQLPTDFVIELDELFIYSLRTGTFFRKRFNILALMFGDQRTDQEIRSEVIGKSLNEVMITEFDKTVFKCIHFPHLSAALQIFVRDRRLKDSLSNIYYYNKEHHEWFIFDTDFEARFPGMPFSASSARSNNTMINPSFTDPLLNLHIKNTLLLDVPALNGEGSRYLKRIQQSRGVGYSIWFEWETCKRIIKHLEQEYEDLFKEMHKPPVPRSLRTVTEEAWFFPDDCNPTRLVLYGGFLIYQRRVLKNKNALNAKIRNILNNESTRRGLIGAATNHEHDEQNVFYNDLDEHLYELQ